MMETAEAGGGEFQTVVFRLDREYYALPIDLVHEIIRPQEVTRLPRMPRFMEGVINLRGSVVPIIDLRKRFDLGKAENGAETRVVVAEVEGLRLGMVVDAVTEVLRVRRDVVEAPESFSALVDADFITGVAKLEDRMVIIMDLGAVFNPRERRSMARAQQKAA